MEQNQQPSFIISASARRSGSTWLQRIVHASSDAFIWGESFPLVEMLATLHSIFESNTTVQQRETEAFLASEQDPSIWVANINPPLLNLETAYKTFFGEYYKTDKRPRYGWKEVHYGRRELEFIKKLFPEVKTILLVRNPIDIVQSLINKGWLGIFEDTQTIEMVCHYWSERTRDYLELRDESGYLFLRYEDINSRLSDVVEFAGGTLNEKVYSAQSSTTGKSVTKDTLSPEDSQMIISICHREMLALGYLQSTPEISGDMDPAIPHIDRSSDQTDLSGNLLAFRREVITIRKELTQKNEEIKNFSDQLNEKEQIVQSLSSTVESLSSQLGENQQTVQALSSTLQTLSSTIPLLTSQLGEKEQTIQSISSQLSEKDQTVQTLSSQLGKVEQTIQTLSSLLNDKEQERTGLIHTVHEEEKSIHSLESQVTGLKQDLQKTKSLINEREQILQSLNSKLLEIYGSTAWRLIQYLWRIRLFLFPAGSVRERFSRTAFRLMKRVVVRPIRFVRDRGKGGGGHNNETPVAVPAVKSDIKVKPKVEESLDKVTPGEIVPGVFPPLGSYDLPFNMGGDRYRFERDIDSIGTILDEFTTACFQPECRLISFRPDNWKDLLEVNPPQAIFVESAWNGNGGSWQYKVAKYSTNNGDELSLLLSWAREKRIPSILWNKEDPPHFDRFIDKAKLFDYVFTSDAECIPHYIKELGHGRIFPLPFAAQPLIHNPVLAHPREHQVCFAGAYYGATYAERALDMEVILKPALDYGLHIYDRQFGVTGPYAEHFRFPDIYQPAIKGKLAYKDMVQAYKNYRVFLNVNSIKTSPTMFSRRVFELLASGTPVISTYSRGIEEMLGNDLVLVTESEADTRRHLENLLHDDDYWSRLSVRGIRRVMEEHTYNQRLKYAFEKCGFYLPPTKLPSFTVVSRVKSAQDIENLRASLVRQTHRGFNVLLLSETELDSPPIQELVNALGGRKVELISHYLEKDYGKQILLSDGDYIAIFNANDHYGGNYLKDYALAVMYTKGVDALGKHSHYVVVDGKAELMDPGVEFQFTAQVPTATLAMRKDGLKSGDLPSLLVNNTFDAGDKKILSLDRFNYMNLPSAESAHHKVIDFVNV